MSVLCKIFSHKYRLYAKPKKGQSGEGVRWLRCQRCRRSFFMNARVEALLPRDPELEDMHDWERVEAI